MISIKDEVLETIKQYERERNGVVALHPERYMDLAEYLEIRFRAMADIKSKLEQMELDRKLDSIQKNPSLSFSEKIIQMQDLTMERWRKLAAEINEST